MAIPTVALSEVRPAPSLGPRMGGEMQAANVALVGAGNAIQGAGEFIGRFALQKQEQVNKGQLAGEEVVRMQTAAQIQDYATKNPDKPETWSKFEAETWKAYEQGKASRIKAQGWGPAVVSQDKLLTDQYRAETGIRFKSETDKGLIRQSNARLEANASTHLASGNVTAALASIDAMTLYPEQRQAKIEQITNGAVYSKYDRDMSDISTLTPAQQSKEFSKVEAELTAKDKDGVFVNGWVEADDGKRVGGLNESARVDLIRAARGRQKAADKQIEGEVNRLLGVYIGAGPEEFNRQSEQSYNSGLLDAKITASTGGSLGFSTTSEGDKKSVASQQMDEQGVEVLTRQAKEDATQKKRDMAEKRSWSQLETKMREKAQDWRGKAMKGTLSTEAVETALKRGEIFDEDAQSLLGTIRARSELDTFKATLGTNAYTAKDIIGKIESYASMTPYQKDRVGMKQRMAMLSAIDDDPVLGNEAKAQAMKTYLDALNVDLQGWDDNGKPVRPHINGREINQAEAKTRAAVGKAFKSAPNLGEGWAGSAMIRAEKEIEEFYTADTYKDDEAHAKLAGQLTEKIQAQVYDLAATKLMGGLY